nr:putative Gag-polypeptide of LTR copia-type [Tanacetum cinerariifolium]
ASCYRHHGEEMHHDCWEKPEDKDTDRTVYTVHSPNVASNVSGEMAPALATSSITFRQYQIGILPFLHELLLFFYTSCAMKFALRNKSKLGFIDGTCKRKSDYHALANQWDICNSVVVTWILNSQTQLQRVVLMYCPRRHIPIGLFSEDNCKGNFHKTKRFPGYPHLSKLVNLLTPICMGEILH